MEEESRCNQANGRWVCKKVLRQLSTLVTPTTVALSCTVYRFECYYIQQRTSLVGEFVMFAAQVRQVTLHDGRAQ